MSGGGTRAALAHGDTSCSRADASAVAVAAAMDGTDRPSRRVVGVVPRKTQVAWVELLVLRTLVIKGGAGF